MKKYNPPNITPIITTYGHNILAALIVSDGYGEEILWGEAAWFDEDLDLTYDDDDDDSDEPVLRPFSLHLWDD